MARAINTSCESENLWQARYAQPWCSLLPWSAFPSWHALLAVDLAILVPMPLITWMAHRYAGVIYAHSQRTQEGFAELSSFVQENLNGIRTVQTMAQEDREIARFEEVTPNSQKIIRRSFTSSALGALMPILAGFRR